MPDRNGDGKGGPLRYSGAGPHGCLPLPSPCLCVSVVQAVPGKSQVPDYWSFSFMFGRGVVRVVG